MNDLISLIADSNFTLDYSVSEQNPNEALISGIAHRNSNGVESESERIQNFVSTTILNGYSIE